MLCDWICRTGIRKTRDGLWLFPLLGERARVRASVSTNFSVPLAAKNSECGTEFNAKTPRRQDARQTRFYFAPWRLCGFALMP